MPAHDRAFEGGKEKPEPLSARERQNRRALAHGPCIIRGHSVAGRSRTPTQHLFFRPEIRLDNAVISSVRLSSLTVRSVRLESLTYGNAGTALGSEF